MSAKPGHLTTLDHANRWGIEPMLSDFKSRGFGIQETRIQHPDRLGRLILVMSFALCWAVLTGLWDAAENPRPAETGSARPCCPSKRNVSAWQVLQSNAHVLPHGLSSPLQRDDSYATSQDGGAALRG